jgi:hypothetical protein
MVDGETAGTYLHDESHLFTVVAAAGDRVYIARMDGLLNENLFLAIMASMRLDPGSATTSVGPTAAPSALSDAAFLAARNQICRDATAEYGPLKDRFVGVFDGSITSQQRQTWVAALEQFVSGYSLMIDKLAALGPPAALAEEHAADIQDFRDQAALIRTSLDKLRSGDDAAAGAADAATNDVNARILAYENHHGFVYCP